MVHNALRGLPLPIYGDGRQVRDWLYVGDHCAAIRVVLARGVPGETYNIGGNDEKANIDVVRMLCAILDSERPRGDGTSYQSQITFVTDRPGHDRRYAMNTGKIMRQLAWRAEETFATGLTKDGALVSRPCGVGREDRERVVSQLDLDELRIAMRRGPILLLGKDGQLGWALQRALSPLREVVALGRDGCDLADPGRIRATMRAVRPGVVVNAAAYTAVDKAESEAPLAEEINAKAPGVIAEEAALSGALFVHVSTDYVFDGTKSAPYVETDEPNPINVYGRTKLDGERAIAAAGCGHLIFRTSWVYGLVGANFPKKVLELAATRDELRIVADQVGRPDLGRPDRRHHCPLRRASGRRSPKRPSARMGSITSSRPAR